MFNVHSISIKRDDATHPMRETVPMRSTSPTLVHTRRTPRLLKIAAGLFFAFVLMYKNLLTKGLCAHCTYSLKQWYEFQVSQSQYQFSVPPTNDVSSAGLYIHGSAM